METLGGTRGELFDWVSDELTTYRLLAEEAIKVRQDEKLANIAEYRLLNHAIPTSQRAESTLEKMIDDLQKATVANSRQINQISFFVNQSWSC